MDIIEKLNSLTENKYDLKLKKAILDKNSGECSVELFYKDGVILGTSEREKISKELCSLLPSGFSYDVKFIKNFVTNEAVTEFVKRFLKTNYPSIKFFIKSCDCEGKEKSVCLGFYEQEYEYAKSRDIRGSLCEKLKENFYVDISLSIEKREEEVEKIEAFEPEEELVFEASNPVRVISVSNVQPLVGELTETNATYIKDCTTSGQEVVICGKILYFKEASFEPKKKNKEEGDATEEAPKERKYFKFTVEDFSGKMNCVYFANKKTYENMQKLQDGESVILLGTLNENNFKHNLDMKVKAISLCTLPEKFEEEIVYKSEPANYKVVFPEPLEYYSQVDLFTSTENKINSFFVGKDIVVFDFETTGLRLDGADKIIEIGAVKVRDGKIIESFSCLINPEMHIPEDSTKTHGIVDDDVKDKPTYQDVIPDFYKFTRNSYLSGYNIIGFDMIFLTHFGKLCGYNFDNPVIDIYKLAQKQVKGVKNYKLISVAEKLGVSLDHAHRAVFDTLATAEVMLKLGEDTENFII